MGRLRSGIAASGVALLVMALAVGPARAESLLWTLIASPLTATTGVESTFTLIATNEDPLADVLSSSEIGCVELDVPGSFTVAAATVTGSNGGGSWGATLTGNRVRVQAGSGGDRLGLLDWVRFTVRATPLTAGSLAWGSRAYRAQDCSGGGTLVNVPPMVVVTGVIVSPTPMPTLPPIPIATPVPTTTPDPAASPSAPATRTPAPAAGSSQDPDLRPGRSAAGDPSDDPSAVSPAPDGGRPVGGGAAAPPGGDAGGTGGAGDNVRPDAEPALQIDGDLLLGSGSYAWVVSGAVVAVPGLLVIAWVAAQAGATMLWIPAVRRFREERRRRPFVVSPGARSAR